MSVESVKKVVNSARDAIQSGLDAISPSDDAASFFSDLPSVFESTEASPCTSSSGAEEPLRVRLIAQKHETDLKIKGVVKAAQSTDIVKARFMLCDELLSEDYCTDEKKEKALDLLYELLNEKSFEEKAASGLVKVAKALMQLASGDFFQDTHVRIQAKIVLTFGLAMRVNHYHYTKKRKGGIQKKDKKSFIEMGKNIQKLNSLGDPKLEFAVRFALETHKRVKDDSQVLLEIFQRVTSVLAGLSAGYNRELGAMVIHFKNALHDIDHHITSEWYDHFLLLDEHARGSRENLTHLLAFFIESKKSMEKCKEWKLVMAYLWLLKELIIHSKNQEIRGRALLGWEIIEEDGKGKGKMSVEGVNKTFLMGLANFLSFDGLGKDSYKIRQECADHLVSLLEKEIKLQSSKNEKFITAITKHLVSRINAESLPEIREILRKPELVKIELRRKRLDEQATQDKRHQVVKKLLSEEDAKRSSPNTHKRPAVPFEMRSTAENEQNSQASIPSTSSRPQKISSEKATDEMGVPPSRSTAQSLQEGVLKIDALNTSATSLMVQTEKRKTAWDLAIEMKSGQGVVRALKENPQEINVENLWGATPLEMIIDKWAGFDRRVIIITLLRNGAKIYFDRAKPKNILCNILVQMGYSPHKADECSTIVSLFVFADPKSCNARDDRYPLPIFCTKDKNTLEFLIRMGANVNGLNDDHIQNTRLQEAFAKKEKDVINLLLKTDADVNMSNKHGYTCLYHLIFEKYNEFEQRNILKKLLSKNLDVNAVISPDGCRALHYSHKLNEGCLLLLIDNGANINAVNNIRQTPLHHVIGCHSLDAVEFLLTNKADINARTAEGKTALDLAESIVTEKGKSRFPYLPNEIERIVALLLSHGAKRSTEIVPVQLA